MTDAARPEGFMTTGELAAHLGVHEGVLVYWRHSGNGPASTEVYGRKVYLLTSIDAWHAQFSWSPDSLSVALASSAINNSTSLASSSVFAPATLEGRAA